MGLLEFFQDRYLASAKSVADIIGVRAFTPSDQEIEVFDTEGSPRLLVQLLLKSKAGLESAFTANTLADFRTVLSSKCFVSHQLFEVIEHQLRGSIARTYGEAKQSLAVRYYSKDIPEITANFRAAYLDGHAAALAEFPGIRKVFCYDPVPINENSGIPQSECVVGNEVVFDSIEDLNVALLSPVMAEVGKHSRALPKYKGWNTHYPMALSFEWFSDRKET